MSSIEELAEQDSCPIKLKRFTNSFHRIAFGHVILYFSYEKLIAFKIGEDLVVSSKMFSDTTKKHIAKVIEMHREDTREPLILTRNSFLIKATLLYDASSNIGEIYLG